MSGRPGRALIWATAWLACNGAWAQEPQRIVVFDVELVDSSLEGESGRRDPAELRRLALVTGLLREGLAGSDRYVVVDDAPAAEAIASLRDSVLFLHDCNGCELEIARTLGADLTLVSWVQKVSNLILNINAVVKDVASGEVVQTASVDIRGNTDRSWEHGTRYLLKNRLLRAAQDAP